MKTTDDHWERFLDPDAVKPSLFLATMFITTFEIFKNAVIDRIRGFYTDGFDETGPIVGPEYQHEVSARHKSVLYASLNWLLEREVIDSDDLATFERLKIIRNQLAHQLFEVVTGQTESAHESQFAVLVALLRKVEVWWIVNFEIPTNQDYDSEEIDVEGLVPGSILSLQMLIQVASGNKELLEYWRKARQQQRVDT